MINSFRIIKRFHMRLDEIDNQLNNINNQLDNINRKIETISNRLHTYYINNIH